MNRSELLYRMALKHPKIDAAAIDMASREIFDIMSDTLVKGDRIEIRNFGSIGVKMMPPKQGRNPKTGERLMVPAKPKVFFTPGKPLKERVNDSLTA